MKTDHQHPNDEARRFSPVGDRPTSQTLWNAMFPKSPRAVFETMSFADKDWNPGSLALLQQAGYSGHALDVAKFMMKFCEANENNADYGYAPLASTVIATLFDLPGWLASNLLRQIVADGLVESRRQYCSSTLYRRSNFDLAHLQTLAERGKEQPRPAPYVPNRRSKPDMASVKPEPAKDDRWGMYERIAAYEWMIEHPKFAAMTTAQRLVAKELAFMANPISGRFWLTRETIQRRTGLQRRAVIFALRDLRNMAVIEDTGLRKGATNQIVVYRFAGFDPFAKATSDEYVVL